MVRSAVVAAALLLADACRNAPEAEVSPAAKYKPVLDDSERAGESQSWTTDRGVKSFAAASRATSRLGYPRRPGRFQEGGWHLAGRTAVR